MRSISKYAWKDERGEEVRKSVPILFLMIVFMFFTVVAVRASNLQEPNNDITTGAQLYDKWYAVLGVNAPASNMPVWERQTTNTRSGPDTWRCSECHGWDYKGSEGAYSSGSHATGFPNVMKLAASMTEAEIVDHLKGVNDPSHDFSKYLKDSDLEKLAKFVKNGVIDDSNTIDPHTLKSIGGNLLKGKTLYEGTCAKCHGTDGKQIVFRSEGINEYLGSVANRDPYRFLHRTRFGVAGVKEMPIGVELGWQAEDSHDVLAYAQSLPTGIENIPVVNAGSGSETSPKLGGPQAGVAGGILTGFGAVFTMVGISALFLLGLVLIGALIVWALRKRN